jgi:Fe-S-cluster-containing hydrogenase component 2
MYPNGWKKRGFDYMKRLRVNKKEQCVGCRQCELICSLTHEDAFAPWLSRVIVKKEEATAKSNPTICLQCANARCEASCPTRAIRFDERRVLFVDKTLCDGCGACVSACPFSAMRFDDEKRQALKCDECGGDFRCAQACPANVLVVEG